MGGASTDFAPLGALQVQHVEDSSNLIGVAFLRRDAALTEGLRDHLEVILALSPLGDHELERPERAWKQKEQGDENDRQTDGNRTKGAWRSWCPKRGLLCAFALMAAHCWPWLLAPVMEPVGVVPDHAATWV